MCETARTLLQQSAPAKAAEHLAALLAEKPGDPWLRYNAGVAALRGPGLPKSGRDLAGSSTAILPDDLRAQVWLQIGNVSFRLVQPQIEAEPEVAVTRLEQGREALRVAVSLTPKNRTATTNLAVVEKALEEVYARLAQRLVAEAKKEARNLEKAIERLEAAHSYAQQAQALNAQSEERSLEKKEIERLLAEAHDRKADAHEKAAAERNAGAEWGREQARQELQSALENFQNAQAVLPEDTTAQAGEKRVREKLAESLAKSGREAQRDGMQRAKYDPEEALEKFETALEKFGEALAQVPEHADARAGEEEVKAQMERLHLQEGDQMAKRGTEQIPRAPEAAAENLLGALEHFQQAKGIAPENSAIQPRIDRVEAQLPPLLTSLAEKEQQQGAQAEARGAAEQAVGHLEQAATDFAKAQQLAPDNLAAKKGQREVQEALARLRQRLAKQTRAAPGKSPTPQEAKESFESMLARVKEAQKQLEPQARHRPGQKYTEERDRTLRNW